MEVDKKIKWGILGCGRIAHKFVSDLALSQKGILYACASRDKERAKTFAAKNGATIFFDSYEALAQNSEIDVIYVATPHSFHYEHSILCMENGKNVLCEKPMGINATQVQTMIDVAKKHNVFLMEAMWTAFLPCIQDVIQCIRKGSIGEVRHLTADFGFKADFDPKSRLFDPSLAGGALLDIGIYPLYISLTILGLPSYIQAKGNFVETGVDNECSMLLSYENGATASLYASVSCHTDTKCEIFGTEGKILIPGRFHEASDYVLSRGMDTAIQCNVGRVGLGYFHEIEYIHECLEAGIKESPIMNFDTSKNLIHLMDKVSDVMMISK